MEKCHEEVGEIHERFEPLNGVEKHGFYGKKLSTLRRNSMACVSLPTCGLALAEAERFLPTIISALEKLGYGEEVLSLRMSGCPNSCSRPSVAELGFIGMGILVYGIIRALLI